MPIAAARPWVPPAHAGIDPIWLVARRQKPYIDFGSPAHAGIDPYQRSCQDKLDGSPAHAGIDLLDAINR